MKAFAELFTAIDQTTKTNAKIDALVEYFAVAEDKDAVFAVALLSGRRPKRTVKTSELMDWCIGLADVPAWLITESYHIVGDLAETITLVLPPAEVLCEISLHEIMSVLRNLPSLSDAERRETMISLWMQMGSAERFVFNKLITGNFRIGVSQQLVTKALARQFNLSESVVAHRLMGKWDPSSSTLHQLLFSENPNDNHSRPYPFYLAYQLDESPETLGEPSDWLIERKYDGIRGQLIVREKQLFVWSRGEELITDKFPEFASLAELLPDGTVLDGEVLPVKDGMPLPFHLMQTRIGRKNLTKKSLQEAPLVLMCYDLIELNGIDLRNEPIIKRREMLEALLTQIGEKENGIPLMLSPLLNCSSWDEVRNERFRSRNFLCEGLMLKRKNSVYESGRRRGSWWKWKVDALTVDGVLLYAQRGHGRRANLYTDYTFAIWDGMELVPFAKAYSGLTDKELLQVDAWIKKNTIDKFGPVRSVKPELVFEIAFEGIQPSPRHKSGIALRFPRISRWRTDKKIEEANSKEDLLQLMESLKIK